MEGAQFVAGPTVTRRRHVARICRRDFVSAVPPCASVVTLYATFTVAPTSVWMLVGTLLFLSFFARFLLLSLIRIISLAYPPLSSPIPARGGTCIALL